MDKAFYYNLYSSWFDLAGQYFRAKKATAFFICSANMRRIKTMYSL